MTLGGLVDRLVARLIQRHARLLLVVLGRQRGEPLLLGAGGADELLRALLRDRNRGDCRRQLGGIVRGRLELLGEEPRAAELAVARDRRGVDAERHAVEPAQVCGSEGRRTRRRTPPGRPGGARW